MCYENGETTGSQAPPGNSCYFSIVVEAEPPYHAFPGGAWERDVLNIVARFLVGFEF